MLETSKKSLLDSYSSMADSLSYIDVWHYSRTFLSDDSFESYRKEISAITLDEVLSLAKTVKLDTVFSLNVKEDKQ